MKHELIAFTLTLATAPFMSSFAGEATSTKGGVGVVSPSVARCSSREIQPLFTRYARTSKDWTLRAGYRSFTGMNLQEARDFDAAVMDVELTIPLTERLQVRVYYPFETDGEAYHFEDGGAFVDVKGRGGVEDFPSIYVDYQFKKAAELGDANMMGYVGISHIFSHLDATRQDNGVELERYNHRGTGAEFGFKMDKQLDHCWTFVGNVGIKYIWESDDLNPSGSGDAYWEMNLGATLIYAPENAWIYPAVELIYDTQLHPGSYSALMIVPEVIIPLGDHFDMSAGFGIGLLDGGPDTDARIALTARF